MSDSGNKAILSCKKENNTVTQQQNTPEPTPHAIHGKWNLAQYVQGWSPFYQYSDGEIIWEFTTNNVLTVEIAEGIEASPNMLLNQSGEYTYSILDSNLVMLDSIGYSYNIQSGVLILDNGIAVDGLGFFLNPAE